MKKIIALYTALILLIAAIPAAGAYNADEDMELVTFNVLNAGGKAISEISSPDEIITVSALVKNWYQEATSATMYAVVNDAETGRLRGITEVSGNIEKYGKMLFETRIDLSKMDGVEAGDRIDLYFWNSLTGMQQLMAGISEDEPQNTLYVTNNITDYNLCHIDEVRSDGSIKEINFSSGDRWSYLYQNTSIGEDETIKLSPGFCGIYNGQWHIDPKGKTETWFLTPTGSVNNETSRIMYWNYTIGEYTEGKKLTISGTFSGAAATLLVMKTSDSEESKVTCGTIEEMKLLRLEKGGNVDEQFEITVPAVDAAAGNDILFAVVPASGNFQGTKLDVTISAKEVPSKKTNSIEDYAEENAIGSGNWFYLDMPGVTLDEGSETTGTFAYEKLLLKGDGKTRAEDEYYSEAETEKSLCHITPSGMVYTGTRTIGYAYTIDSGFNGAEEIIISGTSNENNPNTLTVVRVSDADAATISGAAEILDTKTGRNNSISVSLKAGEFNIGDDIVFIVQHKNQNSHYLPITTDFNINAQFSEE